MSATPAGLFPFCLQSSEWLPLFEHRRLGKDQNVIATRFGTWMLVSDEELREIRSPGISDSLFERLQERNLILTRDNCYSVLDAHRKWLGPAYDGTSLHIIVTTNRCNLRCIYCHAARSDETILEKGDLDKDTARRIVDFAFESPSKLLRFEFQGGEPLLNFEAVRFVTEYAESKAVEEGREVDFAITTNLTRLAREHCDLFRTHKMMVCTSIDGPIDIHDLQRPSADKTGSLEGVIRGLRLLQKEGLPTPGIISVLTSHSLPRWRELIDMYLQLEQNKIAVNFVVDAGRARKDWSTIGVSLQQKAETYIKMLDYILEKFEEGHFVSERFLSMALKKVLAGKNVEYMDFRNPCGMIIGQMAYGVDGTIYSCDDARSVPGFNLGNVWQQTYQEIISSDRVRELVARSLPFYEACVGCAYKAFCVICPVHNQVRITDGIADSADPQCIFSKTIFDYVFQLIAERRELANAYMINANLSLFAI